MYARCCFFELKARRARWMPRVLFSVRTSSVCASWMASSLPFYHIVSHICLSCNKILGNPRYYCCRCDASPFDSICHLSLPCYLVSSFIQQCDSPPLDGLLLVHTHSLPVVDFMYHMPSLRAYDLCCACTAVFRFLMIHYPYRRRTPIAASCERDGRLSLKLFSGTFHTWYIPVR